MNPLFWDMIHVVQFAVPIVSKDHTSIIIFMDLDVLEECQAGLGGKMHVSRWWPCVAGWTYWGGMSGVTCDKLALRGWNRGAVQGPSPMQKRWVTSKWPG